MKTTNTTTERSGPGAATTGASPREQTTPVTTVPGTDELDALRSENERLKETLKIREAREDLTAKLKFAGARSPELLFETAKETFKFTEDGKLEDADGIVADLKARFPEQFGKDEAPVSHTSIDAGSGRVAQPALTREALAKMTPAAIAKLDWADVRRVLSN